MNHAFEKLSKEKQEKIINAAFKEFAQKGYEQASTNQIVKEAQIGKGMLFYYFNNKQDLFHYLFDYSFTVMKREYLDKMDTSMTDIIERMKKSSQLKWAFYQRYPELTQFVARYTLQNVDELPPAYEKQVAELIEIGTKKIFGHKAILAEIFRDDVDPEKAYQIIEWAIRGYQQDLYHKLLGKQIKVEELEPYWNEFDDYLSILKTVFYKKKEG